MSFITDPIGNLFSDFKNIAVGDEKKIAKPISRFQMPQFQTPGLGVTNTPGGFEIGRSPEVSGALGQLNQLSTGAANELGALRPLVAPGFGRMTQAGTQAIEDQRRSTVGDLRENLGRRRVLGSSFASNDISRTNAEFAKKDAEFRAETFLQELSATEQLITKQYETATKGALALIEQSNFESEVGAELSRQYSGVMSDLAKYESSLLAEQADGVAGLVSGGIGGLLGGAFDGALGAVGGALGAVGGAIGTGLASAGSALSGALAGGAATGAVTTAVPGFGASIPMTALPPAAGTAAGGGLGAGVVDFNTAPAADLGGAAGADAAAPGFFSTPAGAAALAGPIAGITALLRGQGMGQAVAQGGGAAAGAAAGMALTGGNPIGAIVGGFIGSMAGGKLGKALGISASGGGDDKPDYSLGSGDNLAGKAMTSTGVWGTVGFGHQKHLTNGPRYKAALDVVTETDSIISAALSPEENAAVKEAFKQNFIGSNSNEGGFNPGRLMNQVFTNRAQTLQQVLGPQRFAELKLGDVYQALASGDPSQIEQTFGV